MEYMRNAVRLAALMRIPVIYVFTHDSIGLGEDGPTHQPVEQIANLRGTPRLSTWRPGDAVESAVAWQQAILRTDGPTALIFSRQNLPHQERTDEQLAAIARGGYVLEDCVGTPEAILIAHRLGAGAGAHRRAFAERRRSAHPRGLDALRRPFRRPGRRVPRVRAARRRCAPASPSRPRTPTTGTSTWASTAA